METVINRHGLDIEALTSSRQPLTSGTQAGESSLSQIAGTQLSWSGRHIVLLCFTMSLHFTCISLLQNDSIQ